MPHAIQRARIDRTPGRARPSLWAWIAVLTVACALRVLPATHDVAAGTVALIGNDAYYHALRAERALARWPRVPIHDPALAYPEGARILWPPLLDALIAGAARVAASEPGPDAVRRAGVWIPVVAGVASVALTMTLGAAMFGAAAGTGAGLLLAVLPAHVEFTRLGYLDHHALEVLALLVMLGGLRSCGEPGDRWRGRLVFGAGVGIAFLAWQGSVLHSALAATLAGLAWACRDDDDPVPARTARGLAAGFGIGAALIAAGIVLFGEMAELRRAEIGGANGFHVTFVLALALSMTLLGGAARTWRTARARLFLVAMAGLAPMAAAMAIVPGFSAAIAEGLHWARGGAGFHGNVTENDPLLLSGFAPLGTEVRAALQLLGLMLPLAPFALWRMARDPGGRAPADALGLVLVTLVFVALALARQRFVIYLAPVLALTIAAAAVRWHAALEERLGGRVRHAVIAAGALLVLAPCATWYAGQIGAPEGPEARALHDALGWLRSRTPVDPARPAVFAEWDYGHRIQYLARKPVLVSPFGTDIGRQAVLDFSTAYVARDARDYDAIAAQRRIGFVLLTNPLTESYFSPLNLGGKVPPLVVLERDWRHGASARPLDTFWGTAASRLYFNDGTVPRGYDGEAFGHWRRVYESTARDHWQGYGGALFKIFEWVPGARIDVGGTPPGTRVSLRVPLSAADGRSSTWFSTAIADNTGRATIVVPYATGANGETIAQPATLHAAGTARALTLSEEDVRQGRRRQVVLGPPG